ncbi:MAG: hypothetical protein KIT68_12065, partial [Phycisphaeraceae bacterium]|nr:hypothetical protein [Phycisphaeraceae bacterium]
MKDLTAQIEPVRALIREGQLARARDALMLLARREPGHPAVNALLARTLYELGEPTKAAHYASRALAAVNPNPSTVRDLGDASDLAALAGDADRAIAWARRAIDLEPGNPSLHARAVYLLTKAGSLLEACRQAEAGLASVPGDPLLSSLLAGTLQRTARIEDAIPLFRRVTEARPDDAYAWHTLATALNYAETEPAETLAVHRRAGGLVERAAEPLPARPADPCGSSPLRVGLLSPDLRAHSVARFIEPALEHADPSRVRYCCYFTHPYPDAVSARLATRAAVWRHLPKTAPKKIAETIRADGVGILVDLCGLFDG